MPLDAMFALSKDWYAGRLDADFAPRSLEDSQALLTSVGLVDEFWQLA